MKKIIFLFVLCMIFLCTSVFAENASFEFDLIGYTEAMSEVCKTYLDTEPVITQEESVWHISDEAIGTIDILLRDDGSIEEIATEFRVSLSETENLGMASTAVGRAIPLIVLTARYTQNGNDAEKITAQSAVITDKSQKLELLLSEIHFSDLYDGYTVSRAEEIGGHLMTLRVSFDIIENDILMNCRATYTAQ